MDTKQDKAFSTISFDGLNTAEELGYLTHDQAQELRTIISDYLNFLQSEEEKEYDKLCEVVPSFNLEVL